jgi:endonuclease/exonuclease/phosphatase family metal-dependent hydrolase
MKRRGFGAAAASLFLAAPSACDPFRTQFETNEEAILYRAKRIRQAPQETRLRVMNYNIKFGGARIDFFFDCHGSEVLMSRSIVEKNLSALSQLIRAYDPDVLFVQEADVMSKRTAYVDQVQWLLDATDLNYGAYASHWKADYVPSDGIGAVDSGNAILSKWPLTGAKRISLPLRTDQSGIEQYFYLKRNLLIADLQLSSTVRLVATHTEAYSQDGTKSEQVRLFEEQLDQAPGLVIGAGDLNALPPGSEQTHGFDDSVCEDEDFQADDYRGEESLLSGLYQKYSSAIPLDEYQANNAAHFTHTTDGKGFWNRKLDYVFTNAVVVPGSGTTHQDASTLGIDTMPLSDHAPVTVEIDIP